MRQQPHPHQVADEGAHHRLQQHRRGGEGRPMPVPPLAQRQRQQRQHHCRHGHLVEQRFLGRELRQLRGPDRHRGQPPHRAADQPQHVALPGQPRAALGEALAQRKGHARKSAGQPHPLHGAQALGGHQQRHHQRHPEGRGVEKHRQARRGGVLQAQKHGREFQCKQSTRQQARRQAAVALKQTHAPPGAPQAQQQRGAHEAHACLEDGRQLRQRGLDQHLLHAPEQAAQQQDGGGARVQVLAADVHGAAQSVMPGAR